MAVAPHEAREIEAIDDGADAPELSCPTTSRIKAVEPAGIVVRENAHALFREQRQRNRVNRQRRSEHRNRSYIAPRFGPNPMISRNIIGAAFNQGQSLAAFIGFENA